MDGIAHRMWAFCCLLVLHNLWARVFAWVNTELQHSRKRNLGSFFSTFNDGLMLHSVLVSPNSGGYRLVSYPFVLCFRPLGGVSRAKESPGVGVRPVPPQEHAPLPLHQVCILAPWSHVTEVCNQPMPVSWWQPSRLASLCGRFPFQALDVDAAKLLGSVEKDCMNKICVGLLPPPTCWCATGWLLEMDLALRCGRHLSADSHMSGAVWH